MDNVLSQLIIATISCGSQSFASTESSGINPRWDSHFIFGISVDSNGSNELSTTDADSGASPRLQTQPLDSSRKANTGVQIIDIVRLNLWIRVPTVQNPQPTLICIGGFDIPLHMLAKHESCEDLNQWFSLECRPYCRNDIKIEGGVHICVSLLAPWTASFEKFSSQQTGVFTESEEKMDPDIGQIDGSTINTLPPHNTKLQSDREIPHMLESIAHDTMPTNEMTKVLPLPWESSPTVTHPQTLGFEKESTSLHPNINRFEQSTLSLSTLGIESQQNFRTGCEEANPQSAKYKQAPSRLKSSTTNSKESLSSIEYEKQENLSQDGSFDDREVRQDWSFLIPSENISNSGSNSPSLGLSMPYLKAEKKSPKSSLLSEWVVHSQSDSKLLSPKSHESETLSQLVQAQQRRKNLVRCKLELRVVEARRVQGVSQKVGKKKKK